MARVLYRQGVISSIMSMEVTGHAERRRMTARARKRLWNEHRDMQAIRIAPAAQADLGNVVTQSGWPLYAGQFLCVCRLSK